MVVAIAGVAHELGHTLGQCAYQLHKLRSAESAGDLKSGEMVGGAATVAREHSVKPAAQHAQAAAGGALQPGDTAGSGERKIERTPHPADSELLRDARHRVQHWRRQVRVLVCI